MWKLHVDAASRLADVLIPAMAGARQRARGVDWQPLLQAGRSQYAARPRPRDCAGEELAAEVAPQGVTVNVVSPAATATGMLADPKRAAQRRCCRRWAIDRASRGGSTGRLPAPANAAAITGQDIQICGGGSSLAR